LFASFNDFIVYIDDLVWGLPLIILVIGVGILLTTRTRLVQIFYLPKALKFMVKNEGDGKGEVTSFKALCTAMSATIGTGNIVGVATAVVAGGPGALFWMWLAAFFGMATKYAECLLAVKFRKIDANGHVLGGPFYYIENGMGKNWKWLAKLFALFGTLAGLLGIGTFTQVNGITSAARNFFDANNEHLITILGREYSISVVITGLIITILVGLIIIGGLKRIATVSSFVVPFMAIVYVVVCLLVLIINYEKIPAAVVEILASAFGLRAAAGGALGAMIVAMQKGVARGIFSNEAGLGSAPIAAAAAQTNEPARQGLVNMTGTFIDTIIICTMTGLSIVITGAWNTGLQGVDVTNKAFQSGLPFAPELSSFLLMMCLMFFAFTTIIGWSYYSERCLEYLTNGNQRSTQAFRWLYILAVFIGPYMTVSAVWTISDIFNGLMAFPNLIALIALSGVVAKETREYLARLKKLV